MKQIKIQHPAKFNGKKHSELVFVYGEDDGVRYNICAADAEGEPEGVAGVLTDYDPEADYEKLYRVTNHKTLNPQD